MTLHAPRACSWERLTHSPHPTTAALPVGGQAGAGEPAGDATGSTAQAAPEAKDANQAPGGPPAAEYPSPAASAGLSLFQRLGTASGAAARASPEAGQLAQAAADSQGAAAGRLPPLKLPPIMEDGGSTGASGGARSGAGGGAGESGTGAPSQRGAPAGILGLGAGFELRPSAAPSRATTPRLVVATPASFLGLSPQMARGLVSLLSRMSAAAGSAAENGTQELLQFQVRMLPPPVRGSPSRMLWCC